MVSFPVIYIDNSTRIQSYRDLIEHGTEAGYCTWITLLLKELLEVMQLEFWTSLDTDLNYLTSHGVVSLLCSDVNDKLKNVKCLTFYCNHYRD